MLGSPGHREATDERTGAADADAAPGRTGVAHRPQSLLLSFFGALVVDFDLPPMPSMVLLDLLADLGVTEGAARATLTRLTQRGLLARRPGGPDGGVRAHAAGRGRDPPGPRAGGVPGPVRAPRR